MFMETPNTLLYVAGGAFLLGWLVGKIGAYLGRHFQATKRDPRDDRIRNLDAELRIAQSEGEKANSALEKIKGEFAEEQERTERRDNVITDQQQKISQMKSDLRDSVKKTAELRAELSDRATESVKSEVKLREVETELSVAQASTDLLTTGVLDYSMTTDVDEEDEDAVKTAT